MRTKRISSLIAVVIIFLLLAATAYAEVWGNNKTKKYHDPTCYLAQKLKSENKAVFKDGTEAQKDGYAPCKVCNPDGDAKTNKKTNKKQPVQQ